MKKSTTIAKCLVNAGFTAELRDGEKAVRQFLNFHFPSQNFFAWNQDIPDDTADAVIKRIAKSPTIHVKQLIKSLS